jgi:hypothetical protein
MTTIDRVNKAPIVNATHRLPQYLGLAAITGEDLGLVSAGDIPEYTPNDHYRWVKSVADILAELGVIEAHKVRLLSSAFVATCPWWCEGDHRLIASEDSGGIAHRRPVVKVTLGENDDVRSEPSTLTLTIEAWEGRDGDGPDVPVTVGRPLVVTLEGRLPGPLTAIDASAISQAYRKAHKALKAIDKLDGRTSGWIKPQC